MNPKESSKMINPDLQTIDLLKRLKVIGVSTRALVGPAQSLDGDRFDPDEEMDLSILYNRLAEYLNISEKNYFQ